MVTKNNKRDEKAGTKIRVRIGKLQLGKETIKDLPPGKQKQINGGRMSPVETRDRTCTCGTC